MNEYIMTAVVSGLGLGALLHVGGWFLGRCLNYLIDAFTGNLGKNN